MTATKTGAHFYSVRTTGVYCRPTCSAPKAKPENVAFHETAEDAEQAGFRPCKRCRPDREEIRYAMGRSAANALAVAVPCYRVVRSDGALSGYRWGAQRKRALLEREARPMGKRNA
jgi:AraC family transcriptional regulator of adaptative response/methylated-DNA-[protein]-cysteine methyltransferase